MDLFLNHFGYIAVTLLVGVLLGWVSYPLVKNLKKPVEGKK